jgi:hypothetical protein
MAQLIPEGLELSQIKNPHERYVVGRFRDELSHGWLIVPNTRYQSPNRRPGPCGLQSTAPYRSSSRSCCIRRQVLWMLSGSAKRPRTSANLTVHDADDADVCLPRLAPVKLSEIAQAAGCSKAYASDIRRGEVDAARVDDPFHNPIYLGRHEISAKLRSERLT